MKKILFLIVLSLSLMGCSSLPDTKNDATTKPASTDQTKPVSTDQASQDAAKSTNSTDSKTTDQATNSTDSKQDSTKSSNSTSTSSNSTDSKTNDSKTKDSVKIVNVSTPAPRNSMVTVTAKVTPHATAQITVNDGKDTNHISGLEARKADANGTVSWSWHIAEKETIGTESVKVTCNGASASTKLSIIQ